MQPAVDFFRAIACTSSVMSGGAGRCWRFPGPFVSSRWGTDIWLAICIQRQWCSRIPVCMQQRIDTGIRATYHWSIVIRLHLDQDIDWNQCIQYVRMEFGRRLISMRPHGCRDFCTLFYPISRHWRKTFFLMQFDKLISYIPLVFQNFGGKCRSRPFNFDSFRHTVWSSVS